MSGKPSAAHRHLDRPAVQRRSESHLPPHESESITSIPVTPGISQGTYGECPSGIRTLRKAQPESQGYFSRQSSFNSVESPFSARIPLRSTPSQHQHGDVALSGTVLSATFTLPQLLRYRKEGKWELDHTYHCSPHLDSLAYLSSEESPWDHTVIAWTGEINYAPDDASPPHQEPQSSIPDSTTTSLGRHVQADDKLTTKDILITNGSKVALEEKLYNDRIRTLPVWLADERDVTDDGIKLKRQSRWRRYAEHDLCALFHYKQHPPTDGSKAGVRWDDYCRVNEAFADRICEVYKPGDIVVVHDHYLMLLPDLLRQRRPGMYIVFSLELPFPTSELVRCLHRREQILKGILGSDLICFQAFHYAQHFANSCTRILGYAANSRWVESPRARVHMSVLPSGINISKITSLAFARSVDKKYAELSKLYKGYKVIIGCDPMDRFGGVEKKLQAFERFLDRNPSWRQKVVLLQITGPSTAEDEDGDNIVYARKVNDLASSINEEYGSLDFTPVQIHTQKLSQDEYFALLRFGDVAINTCVREGMSTTSLEYIACQRDGHGPLIISEFSGTASSLEEAIRINPWDVGQVADQIKNALTMAPEKRKRMHKALYRHVVEENVELCVSSVLQRLVKVLRLREAGQ
ncbi:glycosyltransferase family 20 [Trichoderma arundinaceum]|uniref:Glycosyltransferase family 20 n=1 Tax=Trichoderma arundinaceum TaxID=490622 RepID=A0A395NC68_TRIAR|nr:glycosyltransferase family 20 [Trichoderma arundinaceum]